jgi:beta-lactam-binding protein with PASTA domain
MKKTISAVQQKVKNLLPQEQENPENRYFKVVVWGFIAVFFLALLAGTLSFLIALQGDEVTMVPNLEDRELVDALEELQSRGLNVHVQQRFFSDPARAGRIIDQSPDPGSQVRVGRRVNIIVSRGPVVDEVGSYVGLTLDELRAQLAAQFTNFDPLLEVKNSNISYIFSEEEAGTIISQQPESGLKLTGYTELKLLVSRGPEVLGIPAPEIVGLDYTQALGLLAVRNVPFVFRYSTQAAENAIPGLVVSQFPEAGEVIEPGNNLVLRINPLESSSSNELADIFYTNIPEFALPVDVEVDFVTPDGESSRYFQTQHAGGELTFPYLLPIGSLINVYVDGQLISRYTVRPIEVENPEDSASDADTNEE